MTVPKDKQRKVRVADVEVTGCQSRVADLPDDEKKDRSVSSLEYYVEKNERLAINANRIYCCLEAIQSKLIGKGNLCDSVDCDCDSESPLFSRLDNSQSELLSTFAAIESTLSDLEGLL